MAIKLNTFIDIVTTAPAKDAEGFVTHGGTVITTVRAYFEPKNAAERILWIERGLYLEENNGHIDNMCCFVDADTILLHWCEDTNDPQYEISVAAHDVLSRTLSSNGKPYDIIKVPQPGVLTITEAEHVGVDESEYAIPRPAGDRLPASYINSYLCNGAVIVPSFSSEFDSSIKGYDDNTLEIYKKAFPSRRVIQIPARELLLGGGGIHCILQQVPKHSN